MIINLLDDLKDFLSGALVELWQRQPGRVISWRAPEVFIGSLPDKSADQRAFPFVTIEPAQGLDGDDGSEATLVLTCGVYTAESDTAAGVNDTFNIMTRARQAILALPGGILKQRYELKRPVRWRMEGAAREEGHPYYWGQIETTWTMQTMIPQLTREVVNAFGIGLDSGL